VLIGRPLGPGPERAGRAGSTVPEGRARAYRGLPRQPIYAMTARYRDKLSLAR